MASSVSWLARTYKEKIPKQNNSAKKNIERWLTNNKTFIAGEVLQSNVGLDELADGSGQPVTNHNIHSTTLEYLSAHHYEDTSGNYVDIDPVNGPGASLVEVTYQERMRKKNDSLRRMKFFKPNIVTEIVKKFEDELK